ncbi:MAG TPA: zinc-binding alcohol dehydrogenase family protein [Streptosporangiaceae bacterium]|nr:zinc-binding alcohol dehydrogenase family protein [Streptosporangiaceae bacterium]
MKVRAARLGQHAEPLRTEVVELPEPAAGEVVVELSYAGVNPLDTYVIAGQAGAAPLPHTPGVEGSGTCEGRRVVVYGHGVGLARPGTWAERAVVPGEAVVDIPDGIELLQASAVAVAGTTAIRVTEDLAEVTADDTVLVLGAAGGVGTAVTSLAASRGARVLGQTSSAGKAATIEGLGAKAIIAPSPASLYDQVKDEEVTVVIDALGDGYTGAALTALQPRGRLVSYGTSAGPTGDVDLRAVYRKGLTIRGYGGVIEPPQRIRESLGRALAALGSGAMRIPVTQVLPLEQANTAVTMVSAHQVAGKLALAL